MCTQLRDFYLTQTDFYPSHAIQTPQSHTLLPRGPNPSEPSPRRGPLHHLHFPGPSEEHRRYGRTSLHRERRPVHRPMGEGTYINNNKFVLSFFTIFLTYSSSSL